MTMKEMSEYVLLNQTSMALGRSLYVSCWSNGCLKSAMPVIKGRLSNKDYYVGLAVA